MTHFVHYRLGEDLSHIAECESRGWSASISGTQRTRQAVGCCAQGFWFSKFGRSAKNVTGLLSFCSVLSRRAQHGELCLTQRQIILAGHTRPLSQIKFNREGDLLFSVARDNVVNAWFSSNGERLGTYVGHSGAVPSVDVDSETTLLVTGSSNNQVRLWEVSTGRCIYVWEFPVSVRRVAFNATGTQILVVTEERMGHRGMLRVFDVNRDPASWTEQKAEPMRTITFSGRKATCAIFDALGLHIITAHEDGRVALYAHDPAEGESGIDAELELKGVKAHSDIVMDMQLGWDGTYIITSSKDKSAKLLDAQSLDTIKTYEADTPLNSAFAHPTRPYIVCGGGQEARDVTTTSSRQGKFESRFWHKVFEEECARIPAHFGPINSLAVSLDGNAYASGGEDGYGAYLLTVRVYWFDKSFFTARPYGNELEFADEDE